MLALDTTRLLLLVCLFAGVFGLSFGAMYIFAPKTMRRRIEQAGGGRGTPGPSAQLGDAEQPW